MQEKFSQQDRISYSAGRKISDGDYGSYDFHVSMSTDVQEGESLKDATQRAVKQVEKLLSFKIRQFQENKGPY